MSEMVCHTYSLMSGDCNVRDGLLHLFIDVGSL